MPEVVSVDVADAAALESALDDASIGAQGIRRSFGVEALRLKVREHVALGQEFAQWVDEHPDFERVAPAPLNLICFRRKGGDDATQAILDRVNATGRIYLTHTKLSGHYVLRMSIGQTNTQREHVLRAWEMISG